MEEFNKNDYENIVARYTDRQLIFEMAIIEKQETILYNKKRLLKDEFKKRLEADK